ncbi:MAG TPA: RNA polymerase sigma factor [Polyangiaceae bacterium]|nr:RNA polymerase sigma factor [Polyangiaceae bacterium]
MDAAISTAELGAAPGGETPRAEPDGDILAAIARGDRRDALGLCARRHGAAVGRLCMALLGSQTEAEDAAQETLLAAHAAFADFRSDGSLRAWLFGIARRRCARVKERRGAVRAGAEGSDERTADELLEIRRRAERARALLERVRPTEREALLLRYAGELSFREVGSAAGIDEATARKRVSRALARLRELVKE